VPEETFGGREEPKGVRQARVEFKCGFVVPFRMNCKHCRLANRFKYSDCATAWLRMRGAHNHQKFTAEVRDRIRRRMKLDEEVNGQPALLQ